MKMRFFWFYMPSVWHIHQMCADRDSGQDFSLQPVTNFSLVEVQSSSLIWLALLHD